MTLLVFLSYIVFTRDRWAAVRWYAAVVRDGAARTRDRGRFARLQRLVTRFADRELLLDARSTRVVVLFPMICASVRRWNIPLLAPVAVALSRSSRRSGSLSAQRHGGVRALTKYDVDTTSLDAYLHSPNFEPGRTYRCCAAVTTSSACITSCKRAGSTTSAS